MSHNVEKWNKLMEDSKQLGLKIDEVNKGLEYARKAKY